ncbi:MAG: anaerobic ribonucleoside-triphosphate reductase [bacterium]|nr:anaerobic ribonucleoside-triphosphate reductase [bacterium]
MNNNLFNDLTVVKRSGQRVSFNDSKIGIAIKYAFNDVGNIYNEKEINKVYQEVLNYISENYKDRKTINIEDIQDIIELILKEKKYFDVYNAFCSYRSKRNESRKAFSTKKEHKFVKVVEKINTSFDFSKINPEEALYDFGKTISEEYTKSFVIDNKYLKAYEEGKIYIHDIPYFNLGYLSNTNLILEKQFKDDFSYTKLINELLNVKKEVNGEVGISDIDTLLKKYLLKLYKEKLIKNIENYFNLYGFSEFINIKKISDLINKQIEIKSCEDYLNDYFINEQVKKIILQASLDSEKETKQDFSKIIKELLINLNETYLSNNNKYSLSLGLDNTSDGIFIRNIILDTLKEIKRLENVPIIYKVDKIIPTEVKELVEVNKNINISNTNFSLNKNGNISYFSKGERVFDIDDNSSLGKMIVCKTSINMARLGLKYKKLNDLFYKELDEVLELAKNETLQIFEIIGDKKLDNYKVLFKENILDDEKLESGQKIRKVIKNGTLNINLIGLMECSLVIDKDNPYKVVEKILKYLNSKINSYVEDTKLNFTLTSINYKHASLHFIEIDKALYGVINKITNKNIYDELSICKTPKDLNEVSKYQKYLTGGNTCIINNVKLLNEVLNYDIGYISLGDNKS